MMQKHLAMSRVAITVLAAVLMALGLSGQESRRTHTPMIWDWSNRHLVFSNPRTAAQALGVRKDLRYQQQWLRRNAPARVADSGAAEANALSRIPWRPPVLRHPRRTPAFRRDWSTSLGAGASMPANAFPAKFSFDTDTASCNDYVAFTTNLTGATDVSIVAFNNLYSGSFPTGACTGPTALFAYQTQTSGGATSTSPVLSLFDAGAQIAYIEGGGGVGVLHVLRWHSGDGGTVNAPVAVGSASTSGGGYASCKTTAQSCLLSLAFVNGAEDTHSAPFVDYENDNLYVGDDTGVIHKFTGVFNGTPAEVITGGWPVTVDSGEALTSPVYDSVSNNIYVGDTFGILSFVKEAPGSSVGGCAVGTPPCLGDNTVAAGSVDNGGITDAPIVDSTNGTVFAFVAADAPPNDNSAVFQAPTTLASSVEATIGPGAFNFSTLAFNPIYSGDFDNNYLTAPQTGFLYVCGNQITAGNNQNAALYRIGFDASGTMNATNDGNRLDLSRPVVLTSVTATACSPGTEIFNSNNDTDLMFFSVQNNSNLTNCGATITTAGGGCVMSFDTTSGFPSSVANSAPEDGGTSGIVIDNTVPAATTPQAASLYFTRLAGSACPTGTTGCAVKLTQAGLK